jgi:hypothetical protein
MTSREDSERGSGRDAPGARTEGDAQESGLLVSFLKMGAACSEREHQSNIARDFLGTFSGLFVANYPFWSRNFPFCSLYASTGAALSALIYLKNLERAARIELATYSLGSCRSTTELRPQYQVLSSFSGIKWQVFGMTER